jgi:hypothetical protein
MDCMCFVGEREKLTAKDNRYIHLSISIYLCAKTTKNLFFIMHGMPISFADNLYAVDVSCCCTSFLLRCIWYIESYLSCTRRNHNHFVVVNQIYIYVHTNQNKNLFFCFISSIIIISFLFCFSKVNFRERKRKQKQKKRKWIFLHTDEMKTRKVNKVKINSRRKKRIRLE